MTASLSCSSFGCRSPGWNHFLSLAGLLGPLLEDPFLPPPPRAVRIVPEINPTAKKVKYIMAALVLISAGNRGGKAKEMLALLLTPTRIANRKRIIKKIVLKRSLAFISRTPTLKKVRTAVNASNQQPFQSDEINEHRHQNRGLWND